MEMKWGWRYIVAALLGWVLFLACVAGIATAQLQSWPLPALAALAAVPVALVIAQFFAAYRRIVAQDEFVRALVLKRMLFAAAGTVAIATAWSMAEMLGAPRVPLWIIYPLFWGLFGVVSPLVRMSTP